MQVRRYYQGGSVLIDDELRGSEATEVSPDDSPEVQADLAAVDDIPNPAEKVRRLEQLAVKHPRAGKLREVLARTAQLAGDDPKALEGITRALDRDGLRYRTLDRLHYIAWCMADPACRIAAYRRLLRASPRHPPSLLSLTTDLALCGDVTGAREVALIGQAEVDGFAGKLSEAVKAILWPRGTPAAGSSAAGGPPDWPLFPHGDLTVVAELIDTPERRIYLARDADGRSWTLRTVPGCPDERLFEAFLDLQTAETTDPLLVRQVRVVRSSSGVPFQVLEPVRGRTFGQIYAAPTRDHDALIDLVWTIANAVIALHDRGIVLGPSADDVLVGDLRAPVPVTFFDTGMMARRAAGQPPLTTPDPFAITSRSIEEEKFRDVYLVAALLYRGLTGEAPPHPWDPRRLDNLPAGAAGARLREVFERYLGPPDGPRGLSARHLAADLDRVRTWPARTIYLGDWVGDWRLDHLISDEGGCADIWRVTGRDGAVAALKILKPEMQRSRTARLAFAREARVIPAHPAFPAVLSASGADHDGRLAHYAMELLQGETLEAALADGPFDLARTVEIACQLVTALAVLHRGGHIHGDLRWANIFLEARWMEAAARDRVKLLDLGSARPLAGEPLGRALALGAFDVTAPELWRAGTPTAAADIYSLGLVLYRTITGRAPFQCRTRDDWYHCHQHVEPAPDPQLDGQPRLASLVRAMFRKDPDQRPLLDEVRTRLTEIAAELGLPFAIRTVLHPVHVPAATPPTRAQGTPRSMAAVQPIDVEPAVVHAPAPPPASPPEPTAVVPPGTDPQPAAKPARRSWWMEGLAATMVAGALLYYLTAGAAPPSCAAAPVHDAAGLEHEVERLLGHGCVDAASRVVDRLEDPSLDWGLSQRERTAWLAQLRIEIEEARR